MGTRVLPRQPRVSDQGRTFRGADGPMAGREGDKILHERGNEGAAVLWQQSRHRRGAKSPGWLPGVAGGGEAVLGGRGEDRARQAPSLMKEDSRWR